MIYWITGRSGSGKTTLSKKLAEQLDAEILDGDVIRKEMNNQDYSAEGRKAHLRKITDMALDFEKMDIDVIIACISPNKAERKFYQSLFEECIEIQLPFGTMWEGTEYEE